MKVKITNQEIWLRINYHWKKIGSTYTLDACFAALAKMRRFGWSYTIEQANAAKLATCTLRFCDGDVSYVSKHRLPKVAILRCVYQALRGIKDKPGKGGV